MRRKRKYDERSSTRVLVDSLTHCQHFLLLQERLQLRCVCYRWLKSSTNIVPNCKVAWDTQRRLKLFWQRFEIRPQPAGTGGVGAPLLEEESLKALLKHGYTFVDNVIPLSAFVRMRGEILGTANAHRSRARNGTDHTAQYYEEFSNRDAPTDKSIEAECGIRWQYSFQGADTRWRDDLIMFVPKADAGDNALGLNLHMHAQTACFLHTHAPHSTLHMPCTHTVDSSSFLGELVEPIKAYGDDLIKRLKPSLHLEDGRVGVGAASVDSEYQLAWYPAHSHGYRGNAIGNAM